MRNHAAWVDIGLKFKDNNLQSPECNKILKYFQKLAKNKWLKKMNQATIEKNYLF